MVFVPSQRDGGVFREKGAPIPGKSHIGPPLCR